MRYFITLANTSEEFRSTNILDNNLPCTRLYGVNNRISAGGGFYGVLELSGNVWERAVTVGNSTGRGFEGRYHGNGVLDSSGNPNVTSWPGTNAAGAGFRGGDWDTDASVARLSDRYFAALTHASRDNYYGGRGVRSAP